MQQENGKKCRAWRTHDSSAESQLSDAYPDQLFIGSILIRNYLII